MNNKEVPNLKSNMDRFIENVGGNSSTVNNI